MTKRDYRPKRHWAVANVFTGTELATAKRLERLGCVTWCPIVVERRRIGPRRREEEIERGAFESYLFVDYETVRDMEAVRFTEGFLYFLRTSDGRMSMLDGAEMDALRDIEARGLLTPKMARMLAHHFAEGDRVRVDASVFSGMHGIVERVEKGRARLVQRDFAERPVWLPEDILSAEEN